MGQDRNSKKWHNKYMKSQGNVFIYVLIAIGLLAALTFAISKGSDSNPQAELDSASASTAATSILTYEAQTRIAINQMSQNGSSLDSIVFTIPSDASFNTAPTINKLFHIDGGALQYRPLPKAAVVASVTNPQSSYVIGKIQNIVWTPTTNSDLVFFAYGIPLQVCEVLNKKITGSPTVPVWGVATAAHMNTLLTTGYLGISFAAAACPGCENKSAVCLKDSSNVYLYYSILASR